MTYYTGGAIENFTDLYRVLEEHTPKIKLPNMSIHKYLGREEDKSMKNLYQVFMVGQDEQIHIFDTVVAINEEDAKFKTGVYSTLGNLGLDLSKVTVIVKNLGSVRVEDGQ